MSFGLLNIPVSLGGAFGRPALFDARDKNRSATSASMPEPAGAPWNDVVALAEVECLGPDRHEAEHRGVTTSVVDFMQLLDKSLMRHVQARAEARGGAVAGAAH